METLAQRACVPCRGGVPPLTREQLEPLLEQIPDWEVVETPHSRQGVVLMLARDYRFKNFAGAMAFAVRVGELAEEQQHHPDLHVSWGKVRVEIWTHKIGGLTESDAIFAAKCDAIAP
jgi:4a-hydroxytetrahydrobiopterin dehydratase